MSDKGRRHFYRDLAWLVSLFSIPLAGRILRKAPRPELPPPVVIDRTTPEDRVWIAKAQEARLSLLENTRTAAKDWATTITAVTGALGIVALIEGPEKIDRLAHNWEIAVGVALLVALLCALRGIVLAALAAQGTPRSFRYAPAEFREHYFREIGLAATALRVSRIMVVLGTLALVTAVGLTWYGKEAKTGTTGVYLVSRDGKTVVCGDLSVGKDNFLRVKDSEGHTTRISPEDVGVLTPAGACPGS